MTYPVKANAYHTAIVDVKRQRGDNSSTNSFGTFASSNYQWEAEDYDYNGGSYVDNPQVDAYNTLPPTSGGIDFLETDANANGFAYRPAPAIPTSTGDVSSDGPSQSV